MNRTRSRIQPHGGGGVVPGLVLLGLLLSGCETYFVDPSPPELLLLKREHTLKTVDTPVVYGLLFDLNLPDASECTRIKRQLTLALRAALLPSGREGLELPSVDLSPNCVHTGNQRLWDLNYDTHLRDVEKRYGEGRVRIVLFYFNNVSLPLTFSLREDFVRLQERTSKPPQVWVLATPEVIASTAFTQSAPWSYSADSRLTAKLEEQVRAQLPFQRYDSPPAEGLPLFSAEELTWVRAFKGCSRPSNLSGVNFTFGQSSTPVDAARPPRFQLSVPSAELVPKNQQLAATVLRFQLEVCREHCDRFTSLPPDGALTAWDTTPSCFLTALP